MSRKVMRIKVGGIATGSNKERRTLMIYVGIDIAKQNRAKAEPLSLTGQIILKFF